MADLAELASRFRHQSATLEARAPLYSAICAGIADDPALVELLQSAPDEQQVPVLLLAAVHDQVLAEPSCELAQWYPTVSATPRSEGAYEAFARHCALHADAIGRTLVTRVTQTNEVGRCGLLLPALGLVADEVGALAIVDVGTSAGLNLQLDQFEYVYSPGGSVGGPSPVRIEVGTRGEVPVPAGPPAIAARIGLDRNPIDIADEANARWLEACVWPEQADRFHRLEGAIELARANPVEIRAGDAIADLAGCVGDVAGRGHPVVVNSWVLNYLSGEQRLAYVSELERLGADRDLSWVYAESPAQCEGLPFPDDLAGIHTTALMLARWRGGERDVRHLAACHPHGYWMHWAV